MGEGIVTDNPANATPAGRWKPVPYRARAPLAGVTLTGETFRRAMEHNAGYLLASFSVEEMLRPFRERAGKPVRADLRPPIAFWDTELPGSSAGRFLMGAANTLRWMDHAELRRWMNEIVDGIEECRAPNGYIMAYPEDTIFESERGAYTRAWLTHGLIEAGYAGNSKAFGLLRGYYDWFDNCPYLPKLLRGAAQGVQGMIANTRMYFTPVGKPADIQVVQRYFQENYWLTGLAQRDTEVVWQYPYDRPHNYLITDFEAYLDVYRATGDPRYLQAMQGAWDLYRDNWEHAGGSIAITEFGEFPPKSYRLAAQQPFCETGETCGSVFWIRFNQRFHLLDPEREEYVSEIEKSIYNVGLANQIDSYGIIYHTRLVGQKGDLSVPLCTNSCCEGQGTRLPLARRHLRQPVRTLYHWLASFRRRDDTHTVGQVSLPPRRIAAGRLRKTRGGENSHPRSLLGSRTHAHPHQWHSGRDRAARQLCHARPRLVHRRHHCLYASHGAPAEPLYGSRQD
jgi:DUF1680 family protein